MCFRNRMTKHMAYCTVLQMLNLKDFCLQISIFLNTFLFMSSFFLNSRILQAAIHFSTQLDFILIYLCFGSYGFDFWIVFT
jgi:hypothetical protein